MRAVDPAPDFQSYVAGPARKAQFFKFLGPLIAAENDALVTGGHFPIPTLGKVRQVDTGFVWEPAEV